MDRQELFDKVEKAKHDIQSLFEDLNIERMFVHCKHDYECQENGKVLAEIFISQSGMEFNLIKTDETPINFRYDGEWYSSLQRLSEKRWTKIYFALLAIKKAIKQSKDEGFEKSLKFLKHWSYAAILLKNDNSFYYHNFVQDKFEKRNERPYRWDGFYYNPKLGDKVLEFFEKGFDVTYRRRCCYCGKSKIIAYEEDNLFKKINNEFYCEDCLKEYHYGKCDLSGEMSFRWKLEFSSKKDEKEVLKVLGKKAKTGMWVSRRLLDDKKVYKCNRCNKLFVYTGNTGYCNDCRKGIVQDYSTKGYKEIKCRNEHTKTHYGFELETELKHGYDRYDAVYNINDQIGDLIKIKSDGSLDTGFEIVSHILTFKKFCSIKNRFDKAFKDAINDGCYSKKADSTGLHIHISRAGFKDADHLARFCQAWYVDKEFTRYIAQRDFGQYREWSSSIASNKEYFKQFLNGDLNRYNTCRSARYNIVNLNNEQTVEIRIFKGILSIDFVSYAIELCELIKNYTEEHEQIKRMEMIKYIIKNSTRKLKEFIKFYLIKDKVAIKEVA